jgi:hypothetical protein
VNCVGTLQAVEGNTGEQEANALWETLKSAGTELLPPAMMVKLVRVTGVAELFVRATFDSGLLLPIATVRKSIKDGVTVN